MKFFISIFALLISAVYAQTAVPTKQLFATVPSDPCNLGPAYWCADPSLANADRCDLYKVVADCKYSSQRCPTVTIAQMCNQTNVAQYNGGVTGTRAGHVGYFVLALYWAVSGGCTAKGDPNGGKSGGCSAYTGAGSSAEVNLTLHGLWPDTATQYPGGVDPQPPSFNGSYQGWTQYCRGPELDAYKCHVNGGLCPWSNYTTNPNFTQSSYDTCMRAAHRTECQVENQVIDALMPDIMTYAAGYLSTDHSFMDHEFFKHGSCIGGHLTNNKTAFFETAIGLVKQVTSPGQPGYDLVAKNAGGTVSRDALTAALNNTAVVHCNKDCSLDEIWYCYGIDAAKYPTNLTSCPPGTLSGANCQNCTNIRLPTYSSSAALAPTAAAATSSNVPAPSTAPSGASAPAPAFAAVSGRRRM